MLKETTQAYSFLDTIDMLIDNGVCAGVQFSNQAPTFVAVLCG